MVEYWLFLAVCKRQKCEQNAVHKGKLWFLCGCIGIGTLCGFALIYRAEFMRIFIYVTLPIDLDILYCTTNQVGPNKLKAKKLNN